MDAKVCKRKGGVWNPNKGECIIRKRGKKAFTREEVWQVLSEVEGELDELLPMNATRKLSVYFLNFEL